MSLEAALLVQIAPYLSKFPNGKIGVAVSGGGDSMALLRLLHKWEQREIVVASVDHGLRATAADEAQSVATLCATLGITHEVLEWRGWDKQGNLQDAARQARYGLLGDWATARGLAGVALGHTADDQAETFLMRLARGSGVDGLAAMQAQRQHNSLVWLRPMLGINRADLRLYLAEIGQSWIDDPSNDDSQFTRIRLRKSAGMLADLGLGPDVLTATATQMARARTALEYATRQLAETVAMAGSIGMLSLRRHDYSAAPDELRLRLLAGAIGWINGAPYRPRLDSLTALDTHICQPDAPGRCLGGVQTQAEGENVLLMRELAACATTVLAEGCEGMIWDRRWQLLGDLRAGDEIGPLGAAGLAGCSDWRESGWPRAALMATPGQWRNGRLIAAPMVVLQPNLRCALVGSSKGFYEALITR